MRKETFILLTSAFILLTSAFCLLPSSNCQAQSDIEDVCVLRNGRLIFRINLKWDDAMRDSVIRQFEIDSVLMAEVYKGKVLIEAEGAKWKTSYAGNDIIEVSKAIEDMDSGENFGFTLSILNDIFGIRESGRPGYVDRRWVDFGVNYFSHAAVQQHKNDQIIFHLPRYENADQVYLSGSFNDWSTMQLPMTKTDTGWVINIQLKPGKYFYKYVVDGVWKSDPNNDQKEGDGHGGRNSILYVYNHLFSVEAFENARKVVLSGSFVDWDRKKLQMHWDGRRWILPMYLRKGTYTYKFIVDGNWTLDPTNPHTREDDGGNTNNILAFGESETFKVYGLTDKNEVVLTGDFINWDERQLKMKRTETGWEIDYILPDGNIEYKFIADGEWFTDPDNPYTTGSGDYTNSFKAINPTHIFTLESYLDAKTVMLSGSFNNWSRDGYRMVKQDNKWIFPIHLYPGKYTYKFLVDGEWILDPANSEWEENEFGTGNSLIWITE